MGTRADFYVGRGEHAEWLGSIAWDGYPDGIAVRLLRVTTAKKFRTELTKFLASRKDATVPSDGWPWPWKDSGTTDYAYAFDDGHVWASCFGRPWIDAREKEPDEWPEGDKVPFPDMSSRQAVTMGSRSGLVVLVAK